MNASSLQVSGSLAKPLAFPVVGRCLSRRTSRCGVKPGVWVAKGLHATFVAFSLYDDDLEEDE